MKIPLCGHVKFGGRVFLLAHSLTEIRKRGVTTGRQKTLLDTRRHERDEQTASGHYYDKQPENIKIIKTTKYKEKAQKYPVVHAMPVCMPSR